MSVQRLEILNKPARPTHLPVGLNDFQFCEQGTVNPSFIINNPAVSLYSLDDASRQAIFVELPDEICLTESAYVYETQFQHAIRLYAVPYDTFNLLAEQLPYVKQPVFIHATGLCGSRLLHKVLTRSQAVVGLSQTDVFSVLNRIRQQAPQNRDLELRRLAKSSMRFLFKNEHGPGIQVHLIKCRGQVMQSMDLLQSAFPQARNLFLYREALGYVNSGMRIFLEQLPHHAGFKAWQQYYNNVWGADLTHMEAYLDQPDAPLDKVSRLTLDWMTAMEGYVAQAEKGIPAHMLSYRRLIMDRTEALAEIFSYCGLPKDHMADALLAYDPDSRVCPVMGGKPYPGDRSALNQGQINTVLGILDRHPVLNVTLEPALV